MSWCNALSRVLSPLRVGDFVVEWINWSYSPHLPDNVLHRHAYFEVCQVGRYGQGVFSLEQRSFALSTGDIFFARPGAVHQICNTQSPHMELFWVCFSLTLSPDRGKVTRSASNALICGLRDSPVAVASDGGRTSAVWDALRRTAEASPQPPAELAQSLAGSLLLSLMECCVEQVQDTPVGQSRCVQRELDQQVTRVAVRYIHDNIDRRIPVAEVAAHVHVSPRHLARLFHSSVGLSPAAYIEQARIERARSVLAQGRESLKEAASAVGYDDVRHFSRVFRRRCGISPGAYRDGHRPQRDIVSEGAFV
jgi:AraC-like DNA-binding protein